MTIQADTVVEFHYMLSEGERQIESSQGGDPMLILCGHKNSLPALEDAMMGKVAGDTFSVTLPPEKAYGSRREDSMQRIPIKHLQGAKRWKPGMLAWVQTDQGNRQVTVVKVGKFNADCDTNHPLAGMTLTFDVEIVSVRDATASELQHGHAHGRGGVEH
ncbi:FKBP-type peptidyl-prolyl cis-trans isomerase [Reinekea blandensis]|nr:peptidylprolyl isomerase [Reinekea blandensis]